ncbi:MULTISPECIES: AI-2E family transporter [Prauserella salsuginis group]|uniref:AI-2E family transporter n=1 Tax=Prauserella salsuginis TaxID=387889 RepID=A0ABW6G3X7_9PSEU|nr:MULTISPECIES: AI-2E family transporter [Prauserella salsuginis group]
MTAGPDLVVRGMPRAVVLLIGAASAVVVLVGLMAASWLVGPLFLALVVVITVSPASQLLRRWGLPTWVATSVLVLLVYALLAGLVGVLVVSVAQLAALLPRYTARADDLVSSATAALGRFGVDAEHLRPATSSLDLNRVLGYVQAVLSSVTGVGASVLFLLALLLFLSMEATGADARHGAVSADRPGIGTAIAGFVRGTRRYMLVTTVFGLIVAVLDGVALWLLGIPLPVLWALLAFMTNYIPNVGFVLGVAPPAILGLLEGDWRLMVGVIAVYVVLNFVVQSVIQPRFVGNAVGLSTIATFLSLVLWGWVLGPVGAILAVPLTLLTKAVLVDVDPRARWVDALLASSALVAVPRAPQPGPSDAAPPPAAAPQSEADPPSDGDRRDGST